MKFIMLLMLAAFTMQVQSQTSSSFSFSKTVFIVLKTKTEEGTNKFCLKIKESLEDSLKGKNGKEFCDYIDRPDESKFKITGISLLKEVFGEKTITDNKELLEKMLAVVFSEIENEEMYEKIEYGKNIYYGLSDKEVEKLELKIDTIRFIQNEIKKTRVGSLPSAAKNSYLKSAISAKTIQSALAENNKAIDTNNNDSIKDYLKGQRKRLKREIWEIMEKRIPSVSLIGNANVVASFKILDQTQANAGFGVLISKPKQNDFIGIITVAQTSDTVFSTEVNGFGQSVLTPGVRKFSLLASYRGYSISPFSGSRFIRKFGFAFNANVTPYQWTLKKANNTEDSLTKRAIPLAVDIMFPYTWVLVYKENRDISVSTDFGFTFRYILGNMNKDARMAYLGRENICYPGLIFGLSFKYNGLRVQFHGPIFFGDRVDGLTGGQVYASIGFIGSILSNESNVLKKKNNQ